MISDKLYDLSFSFRQSRLWKRVFSDELFAVQLASGTIGYCYITGRAEDDVSLVLMMGSKGLDAYREGIADQSDCVLLLFGEKDSLSSEELRAVKNYARKNKVKLRNDDLYPKYIRFRPHRPTSQCTENDQADLCIALQAALELDRLIAAGKRDVISSSDTIPLFKPGSDEIDRIALPTPGEHTWPEPSDVSQLTLMNLKKIRRKGTLQCELVFLPYYLAGDDGSFQPTVFFSIDKETSATLPLWYFKEAGYDSDRMLAEFIRRLLESRYHPKKIEYRTGETEALLRKFCVAAGIVLRRVKGLPELDMIVEAFNREFPEKREVQKEIQI